MESECPKEGPRWLYEGWVGEKKRSLFTASKTDENQGETPLRTDVRVERDFYEGLEDGVAQIRGAQGASGESKETRNLISLTAGPTTNLIGTEAATQRSPHPDPTTEGRKRNPGRLPAKGSKGENKQHLLRQREEYQFGLHKGSN